MGPVQNRTREHLGETDKAIIMYRRMLMQAIEGAIANKTAPMKFDAKQASAVTGPPSIDGVASSAKAATYCRDADHARRQNCDWAKARLTTA
jgi:hypothetical protein